MYLDDVEGTCSMGTVHELESLEGSLDLADLMQEAQDRSYKCLVANLDDYQVKSKELVSGLKSAGFKKIGTYPGNSSQRVHVFMRGLIAARKSTKKA